MDPGHPHNALPGRRAAGAARALIVITLLYAFLVAIQLMSNAFGLLGRDFAASLVAATSSPIVGLFIGILSTAVIQSSSVTTSMVVGLVSAGGLTIDAAVPIIMGANIGTSVTNLLVSLAHMGRRDEFRRAFSGAIIHDIFNWLAVFVLFPLEVYTHVLRKTAAWAAHALYGASGSVTYGNPIKAAVKPVADAVGYVFTDLFALSPGWAGALLLTTALGLIFVCLTFLVKVLRASMSSRLEQAVDRALSKGPFVTIGIGIVVTAAVQSSSITTSILVPLISTGLITLEHAYPITIGANIGTTVTALLASLAGDVHGLAIAFVHLLFNVAGLLLFYPVPVMRRIPLWAARAMGGIVARYRALSVVLIVVVFFVVPLAVIFGPRIFG